MDPYAPIWTYMDMEIPVSGTGSLAPETSMFIPFVKTFSRGLRMKHVVKFDVYLDMLPMGP